MAVQQFPLVLPGGGFTDDLCCTFLRRFSASSAVVGILQLDFYGDCFAKAKPTVQGCL